MNLIRNRTTIGLVLCFVATSGCTRRADPNGSKDPTGKLFLWRVSSPTTSIFLVGSLHVAPDSIHPLPSEIDAAFSKSNRLVVEANPNNLNPAKLVKLMNSKGRYKGKAGLMEHISNETRDILRKYCEKRKFPLNRFERDKPWVAYSSIAAIELQRHGFKLENGLDKYFVKKATEAGKAIDELESLADQLTLFANFSPELQELLLLDTLTDIDDMNDQMNEIVNAWKRGDLKAMHKNFLADPLEKQPKLKELYIKIYDERNVQMVSKIEKYLNANETVFVVVGAGHIPGENGVLKLLQKKKYKTEQIETTN